MSEANLDQCQLRGCTRPASGRYTRRMYAAAAGETWPDDVTERPICWQHHWLFVGGQAALRGLCIGIGVGLLLALLEVIA